MVWYSFRVVEKNGSVYALGHRLRVFNARTVSIFFGPAPIHTTVHRTSYTYDNNIALNQIQLTFGYVPVYTPSRVQAKELCKLLACAAGLDLIFRISSG